MSGPGEPEEIPKHIADSLYYHGLLPREDVAELLANVGDYMFRLSQPKPSDPREIIISVRVTNATDALAIRHVIIKRKKLENEIRWCALEDFHFESLEELVSYYVTKNLPINPAVPTSQLLEAIKRQPWEFHHSDINLKELLGAGAFGEVRGGDVAIMGKRYECAVKLAKIMKDEASIAHAKEKIKEMMHEARLMRHYDHLNVARMYGVAVDHEPLMIVIELIDGGSILDSLKAHKGKTPDDEKIENMLLGTTRGLAYLHSKGCIHRDIAARNVLYTKKKIAKISDFGLSREGGVYKMKGCKKVPIKWTAPETMVSFVYNLKSDVFSFSILVWEIFSDGGEPYDGCNSAETKRKVAEGYRMPPPEGCPEGIPELMSHCWDPDPLRRWSMDEAEEFVEVKMLGLTAQRPRNMKTSESGGSKSRGSKVSKSHLRSRGSKGTFGQSGKTSKKKKKKRK